MAKSPARSNREIRVEALATQLNARVEIRHESPGSTVSIVHD